MYLSAFNGRSDKSYCSETNNSPETGNSVTVVAFSSRHPANNTATADNSPNHSIILFFIGFSFNPWDNNSYCL